MNWLFKLLGALLLFFGVGLFYYSFDHVFPFFNNDPVPRLQSLWERDVYQLIGTKQLPDSWFKVKSIKYTATSDQAKQWLENLTPPLAEKADGTYQMNVAVDDWKDGSEFGMVIQYQIVDLKSGDVVWEFGRTLNASVENEVSQTDTK